MNGWTRATNASPISSKTRIHLTNVPIVEGKNHREVLNSNSSNLMDRENVEMREIRETHNEQGRVELTKG